MKIFKKQILSSLVLLLAVFLGVSGVASQANALELVQDEIKTSDAKLPAIPKVKRSDIVFDKNFDISDTSQFTYTLGEKYRFHSDLFELYHDDGVTGCAGNSADRQAANCHIRRANLSGVFYHPDVDELKRNEPKTIPGEIATFTYKDVASDIDGNRLDFVAEFSNLKITPLPNLSDAYPQQVPQQEWLLIQLDSGNLTAQIQGNYSADESVFTKYIECYKDLSCNIINPETVVNNRYIVHFDVSFTFYKTNTTKKTDSKIAFGFRDLDVVRTDKSWGAASGIPINREGIQLDSGVVGGKVYTIKPLIPGQNDNNGFRLRVTNSNKTLEAPCYRFDGDNPVWADGDQTADCRSIGDESTYNTGFAAIFAGEGRFSWQGGATLGTILFDTFGSMLSIEKTADKTIVNSGDTINYNIKVTKSSDNPIIDDVEIEDVIDERLEITKAPEGCLVDGQKIHCNIPAATFNADKFEELNLVITVKVKEQIKDRLTNTAKLKVGDYDNCNVNREEINEGGKTLSCSDSVDINPVILPPASGLLARSFVAAAVVSAMGYIAFRLSRSGAKLKNK